MAESDWSILNKLFRDTTTEGANSPVCDGRMNPMQLGYGEYGRCSTEYIRIISGRIRVINYLILQVIFLFDKMYNCNDPKSIYKAFIIIYRTYLEVYRELTVSWLCQVNYSEVLYEYILVRCSTVSYQWINVWRYKLWFNSAGDLFEGSERNNYYYVIRT